MYAFSAHFKSINEPETNLASKLGDTDGLLEGIGPVLDVDLEIREMNVVPVNENLVDMAVSAALLEEAGHPIHAVRGGGSARAPKSVTLVCERPEIVEPSRDGIGDSGKSLGWFVDPGREDRQLSRGIMTKSRLRTR